MCFKYIRIIYTKIYVFIYMRTCITVHKKHIQFIFIIFHYQGEGIRNSYLLLSCVLQCNGMHSEYSITIVLTFVLQHFYMIFTL